MGFYGWKVYRIKDVNYFVKKIFNVGICLKIQRPATIDTLTIQKLVKKHHILYTIIEPQNLSTQQPHNFKQIGPYVPSKTLTLDLTKSVRNLLMECKKDGRYLIRKTDNIQINIDPPISTFRKVWKRSVSPKRYVTSEKHLHYLKKAFKKNMIIMLTEENTNGAIFLKAGNTAYYWHAFSSKTGRKKQAQYQVVWQGILWAKQSGAKTFDFEGLYDERFPQDTWKGFTHFKKSFGGKEVLYPGAFGKWTILDLLKK